MQIGERLKALRESRGLDQKGLAALSGVHQATISRIEKSRGTPQTPSLERIATALKIELYDLIGKPTHEVRSKDSQLEVILNRWANMSDEARQTVVSVVKLITRK